MFVLFEEDGGFRVATILSEVDTSLQVELPTGKRQKIKRQVALLSFASPNRDQLLRDAQSIAQELDPQFLWECAPAEEFDFQEFSAEVFSVNASAIEKAGLLMALHQAPMYFYRKGRGRYRAAPEESLKAALAGAEKKRLAAEAQQALHDALVAGEMPDAIKASALMLVVRPDKQSIAYKALDSAAHQLQMTPARLLLDRGAIPSAYSIHYARFMQQCFPMGTGVALPDTEITALQAALDKLALPLANVTAFSIDDASTTEVDDAFSIVAREEGGWRVGVHIAAPALAISPKSLLGELALERASTVYFPGDKITMLPGAAIQAFSLDEGHERCAVSLYIDFDAQGQKLGTQSKIERVLIEKNLRLGDWEALLDQPLDEIDAAHLPWHGLKPLLFLAQGLKASREAARGRPEMPGRLDFNFDVEWNSANPQASRVGDGRPVLTQRRRGSPVDTLVSEFMILTNTSWGELLALARLPGIYRVQTMGRVRMQTQPGPHQGLGVQNYIWATSPLRRYSDLMNQWQILSVLGQRTPVFKGNEAELFSAVTHFDTVYNQYADFQETLERYWSQRWIGLKAGLDEQGESWRVDQTGVTIRERAVALREGAFRLRRAPVVFRCFDAPESSPGMEVEVDLLASDALDLQLSARFVATVSALSVEEEELAVLSQHYAVLGDPISHSKSPVIHAAFAAQTQQEMIYQAKQVAVADLSATLEMLRDEGFGGVNLTVPLKEEAFALAMAQGWEMSSRAQAAGAVNTVKWDANGFVIADNTDGVGLVRALERELGSPNSLKGAQVLIIGAGGAAQGVIAPLREAGVSRIRIANRSLDRAQAIVDRWAALDASSSQWLSALPLSMLATPSDNPDEHDAVVINATSASLSGVEIPMHAERFARADLVMDMMYGAQPTPFMTQATAAGASRVIDGLGMLVEQAAEAFSLWRGIRPETASVLADLRIQLGQVSPQS